MNSRSKATASLTYRSVRVTSANRTLLVSLNSENQFRASLFTPDGRLLVIVDDTPAALCHVLMNGRHSQLNIGATCFDVTEIEAASIAGTLPIACK